MPRSRSTATKRSAGRGAVGGRDEAGRVAISLMRKVEIGAEDAGGTRVGRATGQWRCRRASGEDQAAAAGLARGYCFGTPVSAELAARGADPAEVAAALTAALGGDFALHAAHGNQGLGVARVAHGHQGGDHGGAPVSVAASLAACLPSRILLRRFASV